jgi:phosphotransferase system  glucose/maltose/N-acetylglucosamine-specific IIC component
MPATAWGDFIARLHDLAGVFGAAGVIVFAALALLLILGAVLVLLYIVLQFGESGIELFIPLLREALKVLAREATKDHPAIRMERRFHYFFALIAIFSLAVSVLHSLIPWANHETEKMLIGAFITSVVVWVALIPVSLGLCMRLE